MHRILYRPRRMMAALALLFATASALATYAAADHSDGPVRCEIRATPDGDTVTLEALVHADRSVSGGYSFHVEGADGNGNSDVEQSGTFSATPGRPATLGTVTLEANGTVYDADLDIRVGGKKVSCDERVSGATSKARHRGSGYGG
ncbi:curli-like amyloid fiber formation chaperone CsgH (plasmid) [Sinorhizobium chiapasense]|uniref:curli-like amyloid fiber formation chaperone CsgH n=1 Tax=Sinorhizobium chiapasense TaxID=501572 RepID=UPI002FE2602A